MDSVQGKAKKTRKFAQVKRMLSPNDARLWVYTMHGEGGRFTYSPSNRKENQLKQKQKEEEEKEKAVRKVYVLMVTTT